MKSLKIKLPFGLNENNIIVHISNVESGKSCNCICPSCRSPLIAAKGKKNQHHFKHSTTIECERGLESAIHMAAKQIIIERRQIKLPQYTINRSFFDSKGIEHSKSKAIVENGTLISFDSVQEEQELSEMKVDILAIKRNEKLIIEIFYRHKVDDQKIEKIKAANISTLEINLSDLTPNDVKDWEAFWFCINDPNRVQWLYNAKAISKHAEIENQLRKKIQKREKEYRQAKLKRLRQGQEEKPMLNKALKELEILRTKKHIALLDQEAESHPAWKYYCEFLQLSGGELPYFLNLHVLDGDWIFGCDKRIWQTAFYWNFFINNENNKSYFSIKEVDGWLHNTAKCKIPNCTKTVEKYSVSFPELIPANISKRIPSSWRTLREYLYELRDLGMLKYSGEQSLIKGSCWFEILKKGSNF